MEGFLPDFLFSCFIHLSLKNVIGVLCELMHCFVECYFFMCNCGCGCCCSSFFHVVLILNEVVMMFCL